MSTQDSTQATGASFGPGSSPSVEPASGLHAGHSIPSREWQPIKTAPKDGTEVLVGKHISGEWRVCQASWNFFPGCDNPIQGYEPDVWWWNCDADWGGITDDEGPSHWMPMPSPPALGIEAGTGETHSGSTSGESPTPQGERPDNTVPSPTGERP